MKRLLLFIKHRLSNHPKLRRGLVNALYRIPFLDMRLRTVLNQHTHTTWRRVDAGNLPESVRTVRDRLQARIAHK